MYEDLHDSSSNWLLTEKRKEEIVQKQRLVLESSLMKLFSSSVEEWKKTKFLRQDI